MNQTRPLTYLLIGHVTKDLQPDNSFKVGGTVTYATAVVKNLGWRPIVVTTSEPDFKPIPELANVEWHVIPSAHTTTFRNEYDAYGNRHQTIGPVAGDIHPQNIPPAYRQSTLVHLCPLSKELDPRITEAFSAGSTLAATPQGWMRRWDDAGRVSLGTWHSASEILPRLEAAVVSIEDIDGNWTIAEQWAAQTSILIVTHGETGCTVYHQGNKITVPPRLSNPSDPTGAGDVFAAAFFIQYYETKDLWYAARFANVAASMAIERAGPAGAPTRREIEAYIAKNPVDYVYG